MAFADRWRSRRTYKLDRTIKRMMGSVMVTDGPYNRQEKRLTSTTRIPWLGCNLDVSGGHHRFWRRRVAGTDLLRAGALCARRPPLITFNSSFSTAVSQLQSFSRELSCVSCTRIVDSHASGASCFVFWLSGPNPRVLGWILSGPVPLGLGSAGVISFEDATVPTVPMVHIGNAMKVGHLQLLTEQGSFRAVLKMLTTPPL